jgi:hypothetical protein
MRLVTPPAASPDLKHALEHLAQGVESGEYIGLAVVVQVRGGRFWVDVFGRMIQHTHSARGWLRSLDECLADIGRRRHSGHGP